MVSTFLHGSHVICEMLKKVDARELTTHLITLKNISLVIISLNLACSVFCCSLVASS